MILYFDNYITNTPLIQNYYSELDKIRASCKAYSTRDKFEITLYTLASYAKYPWTKAIIVYSLEDAKRNEEFEKNVKVLFPKANLILINGRSDTQKKYQEKFNIIAGIEDEWVFYAGNNDHPFICPDFKTLDKCLKKAADYSADHKYVSVLYSHFSEGYNMFRKGTAIHDLYYRKGKLLEENDDLFVGVYPRGWNTAIQIVNKNLLRQWLFSKTLPEKQYRRIEDMAPYVMAENQIVICPKKIICEHFDGYSHTKHSGFEIPSNIIPPLFIPRGFFEGKIKIRYGYDDYQEGWVNINPLKEKYSFEDPQNGTDLKIPAGDIPFFWNERISEIDQNPNIDSNKLKEAIRSNEALIKLPFKSKKDKGYFFHVLKHLTKRTFYSSILTRPLFLLYKKSSWLQNLHKSINKRFFK